MHSPVDLLSATPQKQFRPVRALVIVLVVMFAVGSIGIGCVAAYHMHYEYKVYPGVALGDYALGGLTKSEVKDVVETANNRYAKEGIPITFIDKNGIDRQITFTIVVADDASPETIKLDSEAAANKVLSVGRSGDTWSNFWQPIVFRFKPVRITSPMMSDTERLEATLKNLLGAYEDQPHDALLKYVGVTPTVVPAKAGSALRYEEVIAELEATMAAMSFEPVKTELHYREPVITSTAIESSLPQLATMLGYGSLSFNYTDQETKQRKEWLLAPEQLTTYVDVEQDETGRIIFVLNKEKLANFITDTISPEVVAEPEEAKFVMKEGKVESFQASRTGIMVDAIETADQFAAAFKTRNYAADPLIRTVPVTVKIVEPTVKTADVNNLGISDVIGVGISTFKNSPTNRIKNIAHAVEKLNGLLIKPGEEFSANKSAGPYTTENGYLPEAVIKGNKITPEVGGGMCQVGTTLFRMAMNSGMPITERTNHSLVVSYYSDPVNGNPGTDATLYEPVLDFKFKNDTGNYLLLQTDMDRVKGELRFTLWGKPDGRAGSYTHPIVKKWIPAGVAQTTYTDDGSLKPGEKKCQNAFRGAVATFMYTRFTTSGQKLDQVFDSYYRPLPQMCLVGAEPGTVCDGQLCAGVVPMGAASSTP